MADRKNAFSLAAVAVAGILNLLLYQGSALLTTEQPGAVCFIVDCSVSMAGEPLKEATDAIWQSLYRLRPGTEAALVAFRREAEVMVGRTIRYEELTRAAEELRSGGETDISEGLLAALDALSGAEGSHSLILFTDGENGEERVDLRIRERLTEEDTALYIVSAAGPAGDTLSAIADETGGLCTTLQDGVDRVIAGVRYRQEKRKWWHFLTAWLLESTGACAGIFLWNRRKRKKKKREHPLPNAGYIRRDEIRDILS